MRKIALLLAFLLVVGSASLFAQMAIGTEFEISGEATVTFGYDVQDGTYGFKNEAESTISIELVAEQTADNSDMVGMSGWVGHIELADFRVAIDSEDEDSPQFYTGIEDDDTDIDGDGDDDGSDDLLPIGDVAHGTTSDAVDRTGLIVTPPVVTASLNNGPLTITIYSDGSPATNEPSMIDAVEDDDDDVDGTVTDTGDFAAESNDDENDVNTDLAETGGIKLAYDTGSLMVAFGLTTKSADDDDAYESANDDIAISAYVSAEAGPAVIDLALAQGVDADGDGDGDGTGLGLMVSAEAGALTLGAGVDVNLPGGAADAEYEIGGGVDFALSDSTTFGVDFIYSSVVAVATDVEISLNEDGGLAPGLGLDVLFGLYDLTGGDTAAGAAATEDDELDWRAEIDLSYAAAMGAGTLTPSLGVDVESVNGGTATTGLEIKAEVSGAIPATVMGVMWSSDDVSADNGLIEIYTTITY